MQLMGHSTVCRHRAFVHSEGCHAMRAMPGDRRPDGIDA